MSRYRDLKNARSQFLELTGVPVEEFEKYLEHFTTAYQEFYPSNNAHTNLLQNSGHSLTNIEDKLLLIWMHHKSQQIPEVLGPLFGLDQFQFEYWINHLLPVLELTFAKVTSPRLSLFCVKFLQALNVCRVKYLIVGGYAVAFHGYRRPLLDLDIFVAADSRNALKLLRVLQTCGDGVTPQLVKYFRMEQRVIRIGVPPFSVGQSDRGERFIQLGGFPTKLEILTSISAVTFEECYLERVSGMIDGIPVPIIGLIHLKRNKQASIRTKDADDLARLG